MPATQEENTTRVSLAGGWGTGRARREPAPTGRCEKSAALPSEGWAETEALRYVSQLGKSGTAFNLVAAGMGKERCFELGWRGDGGRVGGTVRQGSDL